MTDIERRPFVDAPPRGWWWNIDRIRGNKKAPRFVRPTPLDVDLIAVIEPVALYAREAVRKLPLTYKFDRSMRGACMCVSYCVKLALRRLGIPAEFVLREFDEDIVDHAWVEVGDLVVDATATQFFSRVRPVHFASKYSSRPYSYFATHRERLAYARVRKIGELHAKGDLPKISQLRRIARAAAGASR